MRCPSFGSTATLCAGMSGIALTLPGVCVPSASVHVAPPSVLLNTCPALVPCAFGVPLKVEIVAQTLFAFVGSYSTHEIVPLPLPRGVKVCSQTVFSTLAALAVSPTVVRRSCPEAAPLMTTFELLGAIAIAVIEPPVCCALLVLVQFVALLSVRHMKRPPIHKRVGVFGSILKTVMNGNASPEIPVITCAELSPPFVERRNVSPVVSKKIVLVFAGLTATYPPSPPKTRAHAFGPAASVPRLVPLSCVPPKYVCPFGYGRP